MVWCRGANGVGAGAIGSWGTGASNDDGVRVPPEGHRVHHQHTIDIAYQGEDNVDQQTNTNTNTNAGGEG